MTKTNKPFFIALWLGEPEPDFFSWLIQFVLTIRLEKNFFYKIKKAFQILFLRGETINYSHNAIYIPKTGKAWHATMGESGNGVLEEDLYKLLSDSVIRYAKQVDLCCTYEEFFSWLDNERGKKYCNTQNLAAISSFFKQYGRNRDKARNCSEFLARACQFSDNPDHRTAFAEEFDFALPTDTYRVILPEKND